MGMKNPGRKKSGFGVIITDSVKITPRAPVVHHFVRCEGHKKAKKKN